MYHISWKSIQWESSCCMRTDGWTDRQRDMTELNSQFCESSLKMQTGERNVHRSVQKYHPPRRSGTRFTNNDHERSSKAKTRCSWNYILLPRKLKQNSISSWLQHHEEVEARGRPTTLSLIWLINGKKVKVSLYRPGVAQRVRRVIALLFHDRGTRRGWVVTPRKDPVPILQEAGWASGLYFGLIIIIIIIIIVILHDLGLDRPVSTSSNSLFKDLPSRLRPYDL